jgi:hypothetical protein
MDSRVIADSANKRSIVTSFMLKLIEAAIAAYRHSGLRVRVHYVWAAKFAS